MARTDPQVNFRIPAKLKDAIEAAAVASNRTVTAEIVHRLQDSFDENFVTVIEARAKPGPESKHFEFNADEIAEKVVARLEKIGQPSPNKVIIGSSDGIVQSLESMLEAAYLKYAKLVLGSVEMPVQTNPNPVQKGPQRSSNARKPLPKK